MTLKLPPLPPTQPQWHQFQVWWQQVKTALEGQEAGQDALLAQIVAAQAAAAAAAAAAATAQTAATTAQTTATTAQAAAAATALNDRITSSYPDPTTVLTAADVGPTATITIANHTRRYGDGTTVAVIGAALTGKTFSTTYYVYYDDATTSVTTPSFQATTNVLIAQSSYIVGRHWVGKIITPADGAAATTSTGGSIPWWKDPDF